ncbi:MAG: hypothetical protein Q8P68_06275 [Candidatus Peregrinibacteria bacterium]|nr:hypothetical protein [Candidatus Peregrinibacteria bacterium]MDZ4245146.1 hypothetical protein [Candidatus Gracilibacteria bacterium]
MLKINEDKWLDIKNDFLESVDYDLEEEEIYRFDEQSGSEVPNGHRETYSFEKAGMEIRMQVDIVPKVERSEAIGKGGALKVKYDEIEGESMYKITIKIKDQHGDWVDSSAFEEGFS